MDGRKRLGLADSRISNASARSPARREARDGRGKSVSGRTQRNPTTHWQGSSCGGGPQCARRAYPCHRLRCAGGRRRNPDSVYYGELRCSRSRPRAFGMRVRSWGRFFETRLLLSALVTSPKGSPSTSCTPRIARRAWIEPGCDESWGDCRSARDRRRRGRPEGRHRPDGGPWSQGGLPRS